MKNLTMLKNSLVSSLYNMINISDKVISYRRSLSKGSIFLDNDIYKLIFEKKIPKGDPLVLAEIAGLNAIKNTYSLIPLCHPILLE